MNQPPAERLIQTASRLFYSRGIANVGINEIVERANIARMTLYNHFASKNDLVIAVLKRRKDEREEWFKDAANNVGETSSPRLILINVFSKVVEWTLEPGFRGCPLVLAAVEMGGQLNSAQELLRAHRVFIFEFFLGYLKEIGYEEPVARQFAAHLQYLYDGAAIGAFAESSEEPAKTALKIVQRLL